MDVRWLPWTALDREQVHDLFALRSAIFVVEQDCVYLDLDGRDREAHHLLMHEGDRLVAYARAFPPDGDRPAVIGRVVVSPGDRGRGLGRTLMIACAQRVRATWGPCSIALSAQAHLAPFYASLGYRVTGPQYDEDGIPHLPMLAESE